MGDSFPLTPQRLCNIRLPSIKYLLWAVDDGLAVRLTPAPEQVSPTTVVQAMGTPVARCRSKKCECNCKKHAQYIPRPKNAFILFRQHMHQLLFPRDKAVLDSLGSFKTNSQVSREIGKRWRELSAEDKKYWQDLASCEKERHRQKYPDYKYVPRKVKGSKVAVARSTAKGCMGVCQFCTNQEPLSSPKQDTYLNHS